MRYYKDGVLKQGLQIAPTAYSTALVTGIYHEVWGEIVGYRQGQSEKKDELCIDAGIVQIPPGVPNFVSILEEEPDINGIPKERPEPQGYKSYRMIYHVGDHHLSYSLAFENAILTKLKRLPDSPTDSEWGPDANIYFGIVLDDQGFPFLSFRATYSNPNNNSYSVLESVAKKTDLSGLYSKDLTKNEKLRLGFPIPEEKPTRVQPVTADSPKEILRLLTTSTHATGAQIKKVEAMRLEMNYELCRARKVLQEAVDLFLDVPEESEPEDLELAGRPPKRKRIRGSV